MADITVRSFVENVNALANSAALATGSIVDDTQQARDIAVAAAVDAEQSKIASDVSERLAQDWAEKGHNNPVVGTSGVDAEYSSYHWSVEASNTIGDPIINDLITSGSYTWSSQKVVTELALKSDTTHDHAGTYDPYVSPLARGTAYDKDFTTASGENGVSTNVSRADHLHDTRYDPLHKKVDGTTGYEEGHNKPFGVVADTVAEGDHNHDATYMKTTAYVDSGKISSNVIDWGTANTQVPRGDHNHPATVIIYDTTNTSITSTTTQGAITEISGRVDNVTVAENTYLTLLSSPIPSYTQAINAQDTPIKIAMPLPAVQGNKNATNNANAEIVVSYVGSAINPAPAKLIQGTLTATVVFEGVENFKIQFAIDDAIQGESIRGVGSLTLSQYITGLDLSGGAGNTERALSVWVTNLDSGASAIINSMNMMWKGAPDGALVASGTSISHADLTGTGAANGVHTISDIAGDTTTLQNELDLRANKLLSVNEDNILVQSSTGDLKESNITIGSIAAKMALVSGPTLNNFVSMTSGGDSLNSTYNSSSFAPAAGNDTQLFKVKAGETTTDAVTFTQLGAVSTVATGAIPKLIPTTADKFTKLTASGTVSETIYDETSFATSTHAHKISDITNSEDPAVPLQDLLDGKYDELETYVTDNLMSFGSTKNVVDSGISSLSTLLLGEDV